MIRGDKWKRNQFIVFWLILFIVGCRGAEDIEQSPSVPLIILPTLTLEINNQLPEETVQPTLTLVPTETPLPKLTPTSFPETSTPIVGLQTAVSYQVAFVEPNDTLNVRSEPGVDNEIVGTLLPNTANIQITGNGTVVSGSTWMPIAAGSVQGWVNGRFLTTTSSNETFCEEAEVVALLNGLVTAVSNQDDTAFAQLIHPDRGLRVRRHWWNPELFFRDNNAANLFSNSTIYEWGVADGTGEPIIGSFSDIILPLLQSHLQNGTQTACNDILQGGTAGWIKLPDAYPQQFYSTHFAGTDEFDGLDWGSWVVGIEQWQGRYYINYLVHFEWEI